MMSIDDANMRGFINFAKIPVFQVSARFGPSHSIVPRYFSFDVHNLMGSIINLKFILWVNAAVAVSIVSNRWLTYQYRK